MRLANSTILSLVLFLVIVNSAARAFAQTQTQYSLQVGAWGDDASKGNKGVEAEIRTHLYSAADFDYFWVGDNLANGAFIQFGYALEPGYYCLTGAEVKGKLTCSGEAQNVESYDARWQWEYLPDPYGSDFYYGIGPVGSAGFNGTWHQYSIMPNVENTWTFVLDGQAVASMPVPWAYSKDPVFVVAEKVTSSKMPGALGPVEFRNMAFLKEDGWHFVDALYALRGCAVNTDCNINNPYGSSSIGANHILAGSGARRTESGVTLWIRQVSLTIRVPLAVHIWMDGADQGAGSFQQVVDTGAHTISVPAVLELDNSTRLRFNDWNDGLTSADRSIYLDSDLILQANYVSEYLVTIDTGLSAPTAAWYAQGSSAQFSVPWQARPMTGALGLLGAKWVFNGWYEGNNLTTSSSTGSIEVDAPHTLKAGWHPDYTMPLLVLLALGMVMVLTVVLVRRSRRER
jgi:hypothetical protein